MHIILIPGLWLDATTWDDVVPTLEQAGHVVTALTLPGMESRAADRRGVTLEDQVAAVVAAVDAADGPVLLVGHSLGAAIGHQALDARPDRVARAVWVGGFPSGDGEALMRMPGEDGEVAMPDWEAAGEEANIVDLSPEQLARLYADAIPAPAQVLAGPARLRDERRHAVPVTLVCPEYTAAQLEEWVEGGDLPELAAVRDKEYVDLGGGHWPQVSRPTELARVILEAAARTT